MGGFFLYQKKTNCDLDAVRVVFEKKGFQQPQCFELNDHSLFLYRKQLVDVDNYLYRGESAIFCIGTIVYRSLSYKQSLAALLDDFIEGKISHDKIIGNYCLIFFHKGKITFFSDPLNVQHVFVDQELTRISSSFLAMVSSFVENVDLNRMAFYEKLLTGFVTGPDTLVSQIYQITSALKKNLVHPVIDFIPNVADFNTIIFHNAGFESSIDHQVSILQDYFYQIKSLCEEYGTEIGLSSGYDSRLVYALSASFPTEVDIHSHATEGVHESELEVVKKLVSKRGNHLKVIPTKRSWLYSDQELKDILIDNMYFFDGRCGFDMGAFSKVYTGEYKRSIIGRSRVTLTGIGGEMYRNYSHTARKNSNFPEWLEGHGFYLNSTLWVKDRELLNSIKSNIISKICARMEKDYSGNVDLLALRRYYSEIKMPESNGVNHNAHNQVSFYLTPFLEQLTIAEAYAGAPYIGVSGVYEAGIIEKIAPDLAAESSHYGFPLNREPLLHKLRCLVRGYLPDSWNTIRYQILRRFNDYGSGSLKNYLLAMEKCEYLKSINDLLVHSFPEIDWYELVRNNLAMPTVTHVGAFLFEYRQKINF